MIPFGLYFSVHSIETFCDMFASKSDATLKKYLCTIKNIVYNKKILVRSLFFSKNFIMQKKNTRNERVIDDLILLFMCHNFTSSFKVLIINY